MEFLRPDFNEFIELWPAQQQTEAQTWYRGTADAVFQNMSLINNRGYRNSRSCRGSRIQAGLQCHAAGSH